jgi:hypothetical protein
MSAMGQFPPESLLLRKANRLNRLRIPYAWISGIPQFLKTDQMVPTSLIKPSPRM